MLLCDTTNVRQTDRQTDRQRLQKLKAKRNFC